LTIQLDTLTRNARLNSMPTEIGASPILKILTGTPPANCSASDSGTILVSITLPATWLLAASSGAISKTGTWSDVAIADGIAGHFRIFDSGGTVCRMQGTVSITSGGGDIEIPSLTISSGETITVSTFNITDGNG